MNLTSRINFHCMCLNMAFSYSLSLPLFIFSSYFLVASRIVRPGQTYKIVATVYNANHPITVRASIQRDGVQLASHSQDCDSGIPEELLLKIPPGISSGNFKLHVEGNHKELLEGSAFVKEANLQFMQRSMTIFITTDKPVYMQGQTVKFRCVPITTDLRTFSDSVDVYMVDPNKNVEKRWLSRQSNLGKYKTTEERFTFVFNL